MVVIEWLLSGLHESIRKRRVKSHVTPDVAIVPALAVNASQVTFGGLPASAQRWSSFDSIDASRLPKSAYGFNEFISESRKVEFESQVHP